MLPADTTPIDGVLARLGAAVRPRSRVLVIGGYGCGNIGDEAILSVLLDDLRSLGATARVVSVSPQGTREMHRVTACPPSPASIMRAIAWADVVVIGGGGIFSGYMGPRSRHLPAVARLARMLRRRVVFRALGVYASTPPAVARALVREMARADFVSVRDQASADALRAFGLRRDALIEDDPALRLRSPTTRTAQAGRTVGVAVRRVRDAVEQARLESECVAFLDGLVAAGCTPVVLPFCRHPAEPVEQDDAYAEQLVRRSRCPGACVIVPAGLSPQQMLERVQSLDAIVAMRFHAIVFASLASVPTVAVPYDDKCRSFVESRQIVAVEPSQLTAEALLAALPLAWAVAA